MGPAYRLEVVVGRVAGDAPAEKLRLHIRCAVVKPSPEMRASMTLASACEKLVKLRVRGSSGRTGVERLVIWKPGLLRRR